MEWTVAIETSEPVSPELENVDVEVRLQDGRAYWGTFITLRGIEACMRLWRETGECASGTYFWSSGQIVVKDLSQETIETCVADLVSTGRIEVALEPLEDLELE